ITSLSSQTCHWTLPVRRSNAASAWLAPGGSGLPSVAVVGYDANARPAAIVGALVSGSPSQYDHSCLPVRASIAKIVHDSVLSTHTPSSHAGLDGPSSCRSMPHSGLPVPASYANSCLPWNPPDTIT